MVKFKILIYLLFLIPMILQAQHQLSGKIITKDNDALEFVSVSIFPNKDSTATTAVITNSNGNFLFDNLEVNSYTLVAQMLGYEDWTEQVELSNDTKLVDIILKVETHNLGIVEVVAEQSTVESHLGKKVLRLGKDLSATGSNALEALEMIPSVATTPRGQVQIRGNSNVIIYINGKETKRDASTLKFVSAESLEKIEVITNPSAEYDAEGLAGIINIVYKKDRNKALKIELVSNLALLTDPINLSPNGGINFSWTKKKFTLFTNFSHDYGKYVDYVNSFRTNLVDSLQQYENLTIQNGLGNISNALIGFSIEPDSTSSLGLEVNFDRWDLKNETEQQNNFVYLDANPESILVYNNRAELENELWMNLSYEKEFKKKQILKVSLTAGGEDESNLTESENIDLAELRSDVQQFVRSSEESESQRYYQGKLDYEIPVKKFGTIQAGFKYDFIEYLILQKLNLQSDTLLIPDNHFEMDMQKFGGYIIQKKKINKLDYALGVRLEQFASKAIQKSNQDTFTQNYVRLFPSVQVNYLIKDYEHTVGFNYTRRINRPGFFDLNPYVSYADPLNLETGNPSLEPEIADLFELNYHKEWKILNIDLTLYSRRTSNSIQPVIYEIDNNKTLSSTVNIGKEISSGLETQLEFRLNKSFNSSGTLVVSKNRYEYSKNEIKFNDQYTWSLRFKQELKLKNNWKIELSEIYRAPSYKIQEKLHENYYVNVGVSKKFDNKRGSISLAVRDIFNTRQYIYSLHTASFDVRRSYKWQTRQISLGIKYTIVDLKNS